MINWELVDDYDELSDRACRAFLAAVAVRKRICLGLPTGSTPLGMYRKVVELCSRGCDRFENLVTFNLDEYVGVPRSHPGSFFSYMHRNLIDGVPIDRGNVHIPDGAAERTRRRDPRLDIDEALQRECLLYDDEIREAGGLDLTFLGLGRNGHIAFNEPGTPHDSRTHLVELSEATRRANVASFPDEDVPRRAITMGIGTILDSRRIILLAAGERKADAVKRFFDGPVSEDFPASALALHSDVTVLVDRSAARSIPLPAGTTRGA